MSNIFTGGIPTSSSTYGAGYEAYKAFDGNPATHWYNAAADPPPGTWLQYDLGDGVTFPVEYFVISTMSGHLVDFSVYGSNDETNWDVLYTGTQVANDDPQQHNATAIGAYRYYRIIVASGNGDYTAIKEWEAEEYSAFIHKNLIQIWGIEVSTRIIQLWEDAAITQVQLTQWWSNALLSNNTLKQIWGNSVVSFNVLKQLWLIYENPYAVINQIWSISDAEAQKVLSQIWDIKDSTEATNALLQFWSLNNENATISVLDFQLVVDGFVPKTVTDISLSIDQGQYSIKGTVTLLDKQEYLSIQPQADADFTWKGVTYSLFVDSKESSRNVDDNYTESYTLNLLSKTVSLDAPYAANLTKDWDSGGMAKAIIQELITACNDSISLDFQITDFFIKPNKLKASDETPWSIIKKIINIVGAVAQTSNTGSLVIRKRIPVSPSIWDSVAPYYSINDYEELNQEDTTDSTEPIYNYIQVSDTNSSDSYSVTFESEDIDYFNKDLKCFEVPFSDSIELQHSGGTWLQTVINGILTETITETNIEIVDGKASTSNPIYSTPKVEYLVANLGIITYAEDGSLETEIVGNSLINIEYVTKYYNYTITDNETESVQMYVEED